MLRTGQLTKESNPLWYLDFKGYRGGSESICQTEMPYFTMETSRWRRLTKTQFSELKERITYLRPFIQDTTLFYLLSMIVMLDTKNLAENHNYLNVSPQKSLNYISNASNAGISHNFPTPKAMADTQLSEVTFDMIGDDCLQVNKKIVNQGYIEMRQVVKASNIAERFQEITKLGNYYTSLLKSHCRRSRLQNIRRLVESKVELNRAITCIHEVASYIGLVLDLYKDDS